MNVEKILSGQAVNINFCKDCSGILANSRHIINCSLRYFPGILSFLILSTCSNLLHAQTAGPTQPEVQSFTPASITEMVDKASGQFQYNIPLFEIGGYPINISYNSQVTMEQEASMVGLGWNLNIGAITRDVRGIADDANGDEITKKIHMKDNVTIGVNFGPDFEIVGKNQGYGDGQNNGADTSNGNIGLALNASVGLIWNNYSGWGISSSTGLGVHGDISGLAGNAGIGVTSNSLHGTDINPYVGLSFDYTKASKKSRERIKNEKNKFRSSLNGFVSTQLTPSASYNFNSISYTPYSDIKFKNNSFEYSSKVGFSGGYLRMGGNINGFRTIQKIDNGEDNLTKYKSYGFLYADNGRDALDCLMDFNRENEGVVTKNKPILPMAFATQDIYSVNAQGINGVFELKRNNTFIAFDSQINSNDNSYGFGTDLGVGVGSKIGTDFKYSYTKNKMGKWTVASGNEILNNIDFLNLSSVLSEKTYFKNPSDLMFNPSSVFNFSHTDPISAKLQNQGFLLQILNRKTIPNKVQQGSGESWITSSDFLNNDRANRSDCIYYKTADVAQYFGLNKTINCFTINNFGPTSNQTIARANGIRKNTHLSEMICKKPDGSSYVFDVPVYSVSQKEISFSVNENDIDFNKQQTTNLPYIISSFNHHKGGNDDYISITELPPNANSFLLGAVLSANYIDVDNNGPSATDIGDYVKYNYCKPYDDFYWRSTSTNGSASVDAGMLADKKDAKASWVEGNKEIWYVHSIETKNEEARFHYSTRNDAYDLKTNNKLFRLDSIELFTQYELKQNNPKPFKRIFFEYDANYPLCKDVHGIANQGKLTLNKVYFKDGSSNKGKHSAYEFTYNNNNPNYNNLAVDRWGNYKPIPAGGMDNVEFPYVNQTNRQTEDNNSGAWLINKIKLPSGGEISLDYEAHDYAFVQNKRAMYMAKIQSIRSSNTFTTNAPDGNLFGSSSNRFVIFDLKQPITGTNPNQILKEQYLTDHNDGQYGDIIDGERVRLLAKCRVNLDNLYGNEDLEMPLKVKSCGVYGNGPTYYKGYIELWDIPVKGSNTEANQISHNFWQLIKLRYPALLFGLPNNIQNLNPSNFDAEQITKTILPALSGVASIIQVSPYLTLQNMGAAKLMDLDHSYIRLYEPEYKKVGGFGSRVKKITINDKWHEMSTSNIPNANYSIEYKYTKTLNGKEISSGVVSYEPTIGGLENPWKQAVVYDEKNTLMPDDNKFLLTPFGESLFPAANLIYGEVKTTQNPVANNNEVGNGHAINRFYTAYDFPTQVYRTDIERQHNKPWVFNPMKFLAQDYLAETQGFSIVTNDMHGKPFREEVYNDSALISSKTYKYITNNGELVNDVMSINDQNQINTKTLGIECQVYADARSFETESYSGTLEANMDIGSWVPPPAALAFIPTVWPNFSMEHKEFNSMVMCKHVRKQGILDSVIVYDKGATTFVKNLLWDEKTGNVLLTQSINEFKDPIYSLTLPAHWVYHNMELTCDNIGVGKELTVNPSGTTPATFVNSALQPFQGISTIGDVFALSAGNNHFKYVVTGLNPFALEPMYSNQRFSVVPTGLKAVNIQSGKQNTAATPVLTLTSLVNPIVGNSLKIDNSTKIINSEAVLYNNLSVNACNDCDSSVKIAGQGNLVSLLNPSIHKPLAAWSPQAHFKFVDERMQTSSSPNIRQDGYITSYAPFYDYDNSANQWKIPYTTATNKWQFTEFISQVDSKNNSVESMNPLNIFTSTQPSNFDGLTHSVANNARYHETLFENFEDVVDSCQQQHFSLFKVLNTNMLDNTISHTGYYSMKTNSTPYSVSYSFKQNSIFDFNSSNIVELQKLKYPDCSPAFTLLPNKEYIFTAWVKPQNVTNTTFTYSANAKIDVNGTQFTAVPSGKIIDGWQRIEYKFTTPSVSNLLKLTFSADCNWDDVRIFPYKGNMKGYVYSYKDYSLMSLLDENNFATFYEYDQEKQLKRVKKETENGIMTIQEINTSSFKQ